MITIEPLTEVTDTTVEELHALALELRGESGKETPATRAHIEDLVHNPYAICMTVVDEGKIIGMATLYMLPKVGKKTAVLEDVVVSNEYRGQGLGEKLVRALIEEARRHTVRSIILTSNSSRVAAHKLYEKLGFKKKETDVFRLPL